MTIHLPYDRYVSEEMIAIFSDQNKYSLWRRLWLSLAENEKRLGLNIPEKNLDAMRAACHTIDFECVSRFEKEQKHEVMAHIAAFCQQCPEASGIIHLGATSAFVMDNGDLIMMRDAMALIEQKLAKILSIGAEVAAHNASLPCLSYTHYQSASPTTVGKRLCVWLSDLARDLNEIALKKEQIKFLGCKGPTGTQSALLELFDGCDEKVKALDELIAREWGFEHSSTISAQTYSRKEDVFILNALAGLATTAHKIGTDLRLLAHDGEMTEHFAEGQIGSSAMPHKQNPIRCERLCSLARLLITLVPNALLNHSLNWLERSLDDSANRRLYIPQAFYLADSLLNILYFLFSNMTIHSSKIRDRLENELPRLALEPILTKSIKSGKGREEMHKWLREVYHLAEQTGQSPLDIVQQNPPIDENELRDALSIEKFIGRAAEQTRTFLEEELSPLLKYYNLEGVSFAPLDK